MPIKSLCKLDNPEGASLEQRGLRVAGTAAGGTTWHAEGGREAI